MMGKEYFLALASVTALPIAAVTRAGRLYEVASIHFVFPHCALHEPLTGFRLTHFG